MNDTIDLARSLITRPSITPEDAGCQSLLIKRLQDCGFHTEKLPFGKVSNFWAEYGNEGPLFVFAGHTDVVPTGPVERWRHPPFSATIDGEYIYGRGAADMKGSIAAMVTACERFLHGQPKPTGRIAFLITSDEEGPGIDGTRRVVDWLAARKTQIDWCLVGEPSSNKRLGDTIKNGRRGSLTGRLTVNGVQGHIAYPQLAHNPIPAACRLLASLCEHEWDSGNSFFPPTSFQVSNINAGTGVDNVIPGTLEATFNFRYSTELSASQLQEIVREHTERLLDLPYDLDWHHSGAPFLTSAGRLVEASRRAIKEVLNIDTELSTAGGTSDGRFIAPTGAQVIELGPVNATIHQVDECVKVNDLSELSEIYEHILGNLFT